MNEPWQKGRLRGASPLHALFGYMHEDAAIECALLPEQGRALCVLSAGDTAFQLLRAGATEVMAADPSLAQHELVRRKLDLAAAGMNAREAVQSGHVALGQVDQRLRSIARWIMPLVMPSSKVPTLQRSGRWQTGWRLLRLGLWLMFPKEFRSCLPPDITIRLRMRLERALVREDTAPSPWLRRMLCQLPANAPDAWSSTWPDASMAADQRLTLVPALLQAVRAATPFQLVAASNILDTEPVDELLTLLDVLAPSVVKGGRILLRSLFRDAGDWPEPSVGWQLDEEATDSMNWRDRSPLCRVSAIYKRL